MDKSYKPKNEPCSDYHEQLTEHFNENFNLNNFQPLKNHVENCQDCQNYLENLVLINNLMSHSPAKKLSPDPRIIKNLLAYKQAKMGLKRGKSNWFWMYIRDMFEYRIPVYQALGGVVVIFMVKELTAIVTMTTMQLIGIVPEMMERPYFQLQTGRFLGQ